MLDNSTYMFKKRENVAEIEEGKLLSTNLISLVKFSPSWLSTKALKFSDIEINKYYFAINRKYLF